MVLRIRIVTALFILAFLALIARLFYWQIYKGKQLSVQAKSQYQSTGTISAPRGDILSSDKSWLAASREAWLVYASLKDIKDNPKKIAEKLAPMFIDEDAERKVLLQEIDRLTALMQRADVVWVPLKNRVETDVKENIAALDIEGIGFEKQEMRAYPEGSSAAQLLGFVGKDEEGADQGYFGLEGFYDLSLTGKPGFLSRESDAQGVPIILGESKEIAAVRGASLLTNIDKSIQLIVEKKLPEGIEKYGAVDGTVIVLQPKSGAVLAMASYPSYDPAKYWDYGDKFFRNPSISDSFEPGSVFKVLVMAAALDAGVVDPETKCTICDGPYVVDKYSIKTWNNEYHHDSTMVDVIVNSDNVGMVFVGEKLGIEKMYKYLSDFGIGSLTGIDLQGEFSPKLRDEKDWSEVDLATATFGQGVAVTPIQMARAVAAIANDGVLLAPRVVKSISVDNWEEDLPKDRGKRVISEKSASKITAMMVEAAKNGESKWINVKGYKVAGKTGTAQIPIAGHYDDEKTIASFVGFAPYDDPKFVMLVTLREPSSSPWASETAAPLWYAIASDLFSYFGIQPEN